MAVHRIFEVVERQECVSAHNGQRYVLLRVRTPNITMIDDPMNLGKKKPVKLRSRDGYVIGFEESNALTREGESDYAWHLQKGSIVPGDVVTRYVREYIVHEPNGLQRVENIATVVVFGRSDGPDWEATVEQAFAAQGYTLANPNVRRPVTRPPAPIQADIDDDLPF